MTSKMKEKASGHNLKIKLPISGLKRRDASQSMSKNQKRRQVQDRTPVKGIKDKASAPSLSPLDASDSYPGGLKRRQLLDKRSVPNINKNASDLSQKGSPEQGSMPNSPLSSPGSPGIFKTQSSWKLGDQNEKKSSPRFMSYNQAKSIKPVIYRPKPKYTGPRIPTIIGCTPTRLRAQEVEAKRESRPKRILKAVRDPHGKVLKKWRGAVKRLMQMRLMKRVDGCLRAARFGASKRFQEIEYKPLYQLREIRRASVFLGLPKPQRPLSVASIEGAILGDRRRFSAALSYSRRASASAFSFLASGGGHNSESQRAVASAVNDDDEDDSRVRPSLLPFRDWLALLQGNTNPFTEDDDEEDEQELLPPSTSPPNQNLPPLLFSLPEPTFHTPHSQLSTDNDPPSPTSSEATITPSHTYTSLNMSRLPPTISYDPFVDSPKAKGQELGERVDTAQDPSLTGAMEPNIRNSSLGSLSNRSETSIMRARGSQVPRHTMSNIASQGRMEFRPLASHPVTRTRIPIPRLSQGEITHKGVQLTPEPRSSIPVAVHHHSAEQLLSPQNSPVETFSGGNRVTDKPRGPRDQRPAEQQNTVIAEPCQEQADENKGHISSSSSISNWDFGEDDDDDPTKPPTVFTGEYRTRMFEKPGQRFYGPTLKIASSAEKVIMGSASPGSDYVVTQRSNPAIVKYLDTPRRISNKTTADSGGLPSSSLATPLSNNEGGSTPGSTPLARNFCRTQISLEAIPRRDFSGHELSIPRKPVNSPSLPSLVTPSSGNLYTRAEPDVPKILDQYNAATEESSNAADPMTPLKSISPSEASPESRVVDSSAPGSAATVKRFPPRTSSLQAVSDFPMYTESEDTTASITESHEKGTLNQRRDVTFDDFMPEGGDTSAVIQSGVKARLPDSKSTRMLDNFRNIFKSKSLMDKGRGRKDENETPAPANKDQGASSTKRVKNSEETKIPSVKSGPKAKVKYTRLSDGVSWSKNQRNPKSPTTGLLSPISAPGQKVGEDHTPSFARATKSTRTKATTGTRSQTPIFSDSRARRALVVAASTGSPQRVYRRSAVLMPSVQKSTTPARAMGPIKSKIISAPMPLKEEQKAASPSDSVSKKFSEILSFIEIICHKARDETTPIKREKYLRMALALQQQISDYNSVDKEVAEAEALMNKKRSHKCLAESTLFEYFNQVQAQLDEE